MNKLIGIVLLLVSQASFSEEHAKFGREAPSDFYIKGSEYKQSDGSQDYQIHFRKKLNGAEFRNGYIEIVRDGRLVFQTDLMIPGSLRDCDKWDDKGKCTNKSDEYFYTQVWVGEQYVDGMTLTLMYRDEKTGKGVPYKITR